ncbi:M23 family metallopeptidase [Microbacterium sp. YY-01]|uniref:M23 family metallopeptidase n=1 Tax=Microbacterium sp. YY-01 TaxID=3421634 RepID=UPI003D16417E
MPAPAVVAAAGKAATKVAKAAGRAQARKLAKKGGTNLYFLGGALSVLMLGLIFVPVIAVTIFLGASVSGLSQEHDPHEAGVISGCVLIQPVDAARTETTNASWTLEQRKIAYEIVNAVLKRGGVTYKAAYTTMMTAMQESALRNIDHGDTLREDTIGVFQIGPEHGTQQQRMTPAWATNNFLDRLEEVEDWQELDPWEAAHRAQNNERASDYQRWYTDGDAQAMTDSLLDSSECSGLPLTPPYNIVSGYGARTPEAANESSWHPAWDFNGEGIPGAVVYAIRPGVVSSIGGAANGLSITDPESGFDVMYLHMYPEDVLVTHGEEVEVGQPIGRVGGAFGYAEHLDLRISTNGLVPPNEQLGVWPKLARSELEGGPEDWVHPNEYMAWFGIDLCPPDQCSYTTDEGR